jgi:hypothetical protein
VSLDTFLSLIVGAALALLGGFATEIWKQRRARRAAARLLLNELYLNFEVAYKLRRQADYPEHLKSEIATGSSHEDAALLARTKTGDDFQDVVWNSQSDKLALVGSLEDFREIQQAYEGMNLVRQQEPSVGILDALVRTIGSATTRVGRLAGASRAELREVEDPLESLPPPSEAAHRPVAPV